MTTQTEELVKLVNENHGAIIAEMKKADGNLAEFAARLNGIEQEMVRRPGGGGPSPRETLGAKIVA